MEVCIVNKTIKKPNITMIIGILAEWVSGSLFHFVYDWTGKNTFAGLFFPTNESTWEHMKLAFLPMNLYGIYTWYALKDRYEASGFAVLLGANVATWAIPFLYYTYMGVLGFSKMWLDIATFFVAVLTGFAVEYHVLRRAGHESFVLGTWIMAIVDFMMATNHFDRDSIKKLLPSLVENALTDTRVISVSNFEFTDFDADSLLVTFDVDTIYGSTKVKEVPINV